MTISLLESLRKSTHPGMERDIEEAGRIISGIGLPPGASLRPPENMEGGAYTMQIRVRSEEGLRTALEKAGAALEAGTFARLLDPFQRY